MGIFDGCVLASDIDGTLVESNYINPKNIEKIEFFISEGGLFSFSTGRSIGALGNILPHFKRVSPSVVGNGCMIYDFTEKKLIYEELVPRDDYYIAELLMNSGIDVGIEIHSRENVLSIRANKTSVLHAQYEDFTVDNVDFNTASDYTWNKVLYAFNSAEDREKGIAIIEKESTTSSFMKTAAVIGGETQYYYEQVPAGASKASALSKLCEIYGIDSSNLFAIGDFYNDIEMLKSANIAAVPCTSPDDIKQLANYITVSCNDGAVADFIDYLINKYAK